MLEGEREEMWRFSDLTPGLLDVIAALRSHTVAESNCYLFCDQHLSFILI